MFARKKGFRLLLVVVGTLVLAGAFYAFAAANTVPDTQAGSGSGTISGYTVTNVHYTISEDQVTAVSFDIGSSTAVTVVAQIVNPSGEWAPCTNTSDTIWSCAFASVDASSVNTLTVTAAD